MPSGGYLREDLSRCRNHSWGFLPAKKLTLIPNLRKYPICLRDLFSVRRSNDECFYTANLSARNISESLNRHPNIPTTVPASSHGNASLQI